ncbi:MAG: sporulation protein [Candidatus Scalindua rubra]|uniref:Sporulation protein n=1 Tax=Candidatus Scalindua rubra TaxID=1872076 RepID=A0A1E3XBI8_9BACT|nr:MAG: sporulation protein [Candidatus Scalindua rubra]
MFVVNSNIKYALFGLFFVFLSIALLVSCLSINNNAEAVFKYDKYLSKPPDIRVLLLKDVKETEIEINYPYSISGMDNNTVLDRGANLPKSTVSLKSGKFQIKTISSHSTSKASTYYVKANGKIIITSHDSNGFVKLNKSKYRGKIILLPHNKDRFSALEEIDIEEYLPGVIESEIPTKWQDDAILAQVVAARSYAIYQRKIKNNAIYHIDKLDLAYNGSYTFQPKTKEIVDKSRGTVMVYNWELFPGYFHSTCGGHTEDINLVFKLKSITPLSGVDCGYCNKSKYYNWKKKFGKGEIEKKLNRAKTKVKKIHDLVTEEIGPGGHCSIIRIKHSRGTKRINANEFRLILGPNKLRSTAFKIKNNGSSLIFEGKGWGHGVGLCQYGTQDMANSGFKWSDILKHYYPGMDLVKIY